MIALHRLNHLTASGAWRSACLAAFEHAADPREHARAARLRREADRLAYGMSHGFLRLVLAGSTGRAPRDIVLAAAAGGKPVCVDGPHFNMSHAGGLTVVAVSVEAEMGVDVEALAEGPAAGSFVPMAAAEEDRRVLPLLSGRRHHAETMLWSIKEAALKLTGDVMIEPDRLAVRPLRGGLFRVGTARAASAPVHEAFVRLLPAGDGHVLSLATYEPLPVSEIVDPRVGVAPDGRLGPPGSGTPVASGPSLAA